MSTLDANEIVHIKIDAIWADPAFNCRGHVSPMDVIDLSKDIEKHGLQQPITVMPAKGNDKYDWQVVSGHRRYTSFKVLKRETIPCVVTTHLTESQALVLNLGENLHRKDLNIMQEAKAIERLKLTGFTVIEVSKQLNKSTTWVHIRYMLLELPEEIREAAAAGYVNQKQIKQIHDQPTRERQIEVTKKIKKAKVNGEKAPSIVKTKRDMFKRKPREIDGITFMQTHVREAIGNNFGTRCMAWAMGEISDLELYRDVQKIADEAGISYDIPYDTKEKV